MSTGLDLREHEALAAGPPPGRWRPIAIVALVLAVIAASVALFVLVRDDGDPDPTPSPAPSASSSPSASPSPSPSESPEPTQTPTPTPSPTPTAVVPNAPIDAVWPLTTTREVAAWRADHSAHPYLANPADTALAFATRFLRIANASVRRTSAGTYEVTRPNPNGRPMVITRVDVQPVGGQAPYVVRSAAKSEELRVSTPAAGATILPPLRAYGTYRAVDPSILVEVRATGGERGYSLGFGRATYSPAGWTARVEFVNTVRRSGVVVVTNGALYDEGISAAAVVRVVLGTPPPLPAPPLTFVGVVNGQIALLRTDTGALVRYLAPPTAARDDYLPSLTADRTRVRFNRGRALMEVGVSGTGLRTLATRAAGAVVAGVDTVRGLAYVGSDTAASRWDVVLRAPDGTDTILGSYGFVQPWVTASRDGRYVYVLTGPAVGGPLALRRVDVTRQSADVTVAPSPGYQWQTLSAGYLDGAYPTVVAARYGGGTSSIVAFDEALGHQRALLPLGRAAVSKLAVDRTGRHLLLWRTDTGTTTVVQRWITGRVYEIARGASSPVW